MDQRSGLTYVGERFDGDTMRVDPWGRLWVLNPERPPRVLIVNPDGSEHLELLTIQPPHADAPR